MDHLTQHALLTLAHSIDRTREIMEREFQWRKDHRGLVTKFDLTVAKEEIIRAVKDFGCKPEGPCADRGRFDIAFGLPKNKERTNHMVETTITNEQKVGVTLTPKTATGKSAKVQAGSVKFSVISGDSTVVQDPANELSASLVSSDTPGDTQILVEADADIGEGVETISDTITLHVSGANAANLGVAVGTPEPK